MYFAFLDICASIFDKWNDLSAAGKLVIGVVLLFLSYSAVYGLGTCNGNERHQLSRQQINQQATAQAYSARTARPTAIPTSVSASAMPKVRVTESELGDKWPLTVSNGWVSVKNCRALPSGTGKICERIFTTEDGKDYALNGIAIGAGYPDIAEIAKRTNGVYHSGLWELSKLAANLYE